MEGEDFWKSLGVDSEVVELVVKMGLWWDEESGHLVVLDKCRGQENIYQRIQDALLGLWEFRTFSDSRWVTVGVSCRGVVAGLQSGLEAYVKFLRQTKKAKDEFLHGFGRVQEEHKQFLVVAGLSSYVAETVLALLMEDNRVAKRVEELEEAMWGAVGWLDEVSSAMWGSLGRLCNMSGRELKSCCVAAGHIQGAFIYDKFF